MIETGLGRQSNDEGHRHTTRKSAVRHPDLRPMVTFDRLNIDSINFNRDSPGCPPYLAGRPALRPEISFSSPAANNRSAGPQGQCFGITQMIYGGMRNENEIRRSQLMGFDWAARILVEEGIYQNASPLAVEQLVRRHSKITNYHTHENPRLVTESKLRPSVKAGFHCLHQVNHRAVIRRRNTEPHSSFYDRAVDYINFRPAPILDILKH